MNLFGGFLVLFFFAGSLFASGPVKVRLKRDVQQINISGFDLRFGSVQIDSSFKLKIQKANVRLKYVKNHPPMDS